MKRSSQFGRHTSSESAVSQTQPVNGDLDDFDSDDSIGYSDPEHDSAKRRKKSKNQKHPKFRFKDEKQAKSRDKVVNGKKDVVGKVRMNVCRYCGFSSAKSLQKHFAKVCRSF